MKTNIVYILLGLLIALPIIASVFSYFGFYEICVGVSASFMVAAVVTLLCYLDNGFSK